MSKSKKAGSPCSMATQAGTRLDPGRTGGAGDHAGKPSSRSSFHQESAPHTFRFAAGCLRRKRPDFHSRRLREKLVKLVQRVQPEDTPFTGLIISPTLQYNFTESFTVKMKVFAEEFHKPVSFSCPAATRVGFLIDSLKPFLGNPSGEYVFKVTGFEEYFSNDSVLSDYERVCACKRLDKDVWLTVVDLKTVERKWRLSTQDSCGLDIESDALDEPSFDHVKDRVLSFEASAGELLSPVQSEDDDTAIVLDKVRASIVNLCAVLKACETSELYQAVTDLENFYADTVAENRDDLSYERRLLLTAQLLEDIESSAARLVDIYSQKRAVDFEVEFFDGALRRSRTVDASDPFCPRIEMLLQLQEGWVNNYDAYRVHSSLVHGERVLAWRETRNVFVTRKFFNCVNFSETLSFSELQLRSLPRESRMYLTVIGRRDGTDDVVGWTAINLFADRDRFNGGDFFLGLWPPTVDSRRGPASGNENNVGSIHLSMPHVVNQPAAVKSLSLEEHHQERRPFSELDDEIQGTFLSLAVSDTAQTLDPSLGQKLWLHRYHLCDYAGLLPYFLSLPVCYQPENLHEVYELLQMWNPLSAEEALALLAPSYPDSLVRKYAVQCLQSLGSDELSLYLPHLVESLKFECWDDSHVALFLLRRARICVRLAHQLYWLLKGMMDETLMRCRVRLMIKALFYVAGEQVASSLQSQITLDGALLEIAHRVKEGEAQRDKVLRQDLARLDESLRMSSVTLPLDPAFSVQGVYPDGCCVFPSKTLPIKLVFAPSDKVAEKLEVIYKVGDDLRQDMFMLNLIRLMDKFWLESGLDLRILTFKCTATGKNRGMLEAVRDVCSLRHIQTEHSGVTGAFNTRTIADWLRKQQPEPSSYQHAIDNFVKSCAGYCVATYILGVGDRHNDNILLATSGHMLHVDFGKVLGKAETFGGIRRDRAPVALTPDMVHVIRKHGSDAEFVRMCCDAYCIVRRNAAVFLSLFKVMAFSGIGDIGGRAVGFLRQSMALHTTEEQAARLFEKRIRESVATIATSINFFIHNIASRGAQAGDCALKLSFNPKEFSIAAEGRIVALVVEELRLRYHPERYYVYVVRVARQFPPTQTVLRTYKQFLELYSKMRKKFPRCNFHPLTRGPVFSSESDEVLALKRKREIELFLDSVMAQSEEVAHYKLMYSFFHPLPKDVEVVHGAAVRIIP